SRIFGPLAGDDPTASMTGHCHDISSQATTFRGTSHAPARLSRLGCVCGPKMNKMSVTQVSLMTQTHRASASAPEKKTTGPDDISHGVAEELTALRSIVEGTAGSTGQDFFQTLVRHLAQAVDAQYAFVAEFTSRETTTSARTVAFWARDRIADN